MKFFDQLNKIAESVLDTLDKTAQRVNKKIQESNINEVIEKSFEKTSKQVDNIIKNTKDYLEKDFKDIKSQNPEEKNESVQEEKKEKVKITPSAKTLLIDYLSDSEVQGLNFTPFDIVLKSLGAVADERIPGKWKMKNDNVIQTVHNKWYCFNNGIRGEGAIELVNFDLTGGQTFDLQNTPKNKHMTNDALNILKNIQEEKSYQEQLSIWIKNEQVFTSKKTKAPKR